MSARAPAIGGLPENVVAGWIEAQRPNPVAFLVVAGASFFLGAPLLAATNELPVAPEDPSLLALLSAAASHAVEAGDWGVLGSTLASALGAAWSVHWLFRSARDRFGTPPIVRALRERPTSIVWAYPTRVTHATVNGLTEHVTGHSSTITLGLEDGRLFHDLPLRDEEVQPVLSALRALSPRVVIGHTDELQRRFRRSPRTFATPG